MSNKNIHVIGAGLSGSLLALRLGQMGHQVHLIEKRPDLRDVEMDAGRSINLALSSRGLRALSQAGLDDDVAALCIPMRGRMIHQIDGSTRFSAYSGRADEYINSISRPGLNALLLDEIDKCSSVRTSFDKGLHHVDFDQKILHFYDQSTEKYEYLFGSDGVGSAVRRSMMPHSGSIRFDYSQKFLSHGYKELEIPADAYGKHQLDKHSLHIWPRGEFMLIALPNMDGSFTVTLFLAFEGTDSFEGLQTDSEIASFFERYFPDARMLMPDLIADFHNNPTAPLSTIKCHPWSVPGAHNLLIGDSAHAIVPFYGQGMNASFEDVYIFEQMLAKHQDIDVAMSLYDDERKSDTDAIADLAIDNFYEMRDHVDDPEFIKKRQLEILLEKQFPDYYSKYALVTFRPDMSYAQAMKIGREQDTFLLEIVADKLLDQLDLDEVMSDIRSKFRY